MVPSTSHCAWHQRARLIFTTAVAMVSLTAAANPTLRTARPDPLDATATVPTVPYASSLKLEQRTPTDGPGSWREANDTVTRIGGWRVYAREARQPASDPKAPSAAAAAQAPATASPPAPATTPHAHVGHPTP
jgi:hypothetical protein